MKFQLIRNATFKLWYNQQCFLIDPMLSTKDAFEPFAPGLKRNPTIELSISPSKVVNEVSAVLVTHSHPDHFDQPAANHLPADIPIFSTPTDQQFIESFGFTNNRTVHESTEWNDIRITRIEGQHGSGPVLKYTGLVSGYVLESKNEPTIFILGDSITTPTIKSAIDEFKPDYIVTNSGGGILPSFEDFPVTMDEKETVNLCTSFPNSKFIAVHIESIDFCRVTRSSLRSAALDANVSDQQLLIPKDGELIQL